MFHPQSMDHSLPSDRFEELLAHRAWVQRVARALVWDESRSDDLEQETWLRALESPPPRPSRAWFGTVLRNVASNLRRGEMRRGVHELRVAGSEPPASPDDLLARAEIVERVARAVRELREPHRTAVLLRYFEDLSPPEIAARLGVPLETVRTRLKRGLAVLRRRLDEDADCDRRAWVVALLPQIRAPRPVPSATTTTATGVLLMTVKAKLLAAAMVLLVAAMAVWLSTDRRTSDAGDLSAVPGADTGSATEASRPRRARATAGGEETAPALVPTAAVPADESVERARWAVRVTTNVPSSKVTVAPRYFAGEADPPPTTKTADAQGFAGFSLPDRDDPLAVCVVTVRAEGYATVRTESPPGDVRVDLGRGVALRGRIVDDTDSPISDVSITDRDVAFFQVTEADGTFEAFVKKDGPVAFHVAHPGFLAQDVMAMAPGDGLRIVLARGLEITGRVAFPDLRPVPGAAITDSAGRDRATTDDDGRFRVRGVAPGPFEILCALTGERRTVDAGAAGVDFVVRVPVARVRLVDEKHRPFRLAVAWMRVVLDGKDLLTSATNGSATGLSLVRGTPGARLLVSPDARGYDQTVTTIDFGDAPWLHDVEVVVARGGPRGRVRLEVRGDDGTVPSPVFVTLEDESGSPCAGCYGKEVRPDATARVELPAVAPGPYDVTVDVQPKWSLEGFWLRARGRVSVTAGQDAALVLTMSRGGRVRATVRTETGDSVVPQRLDLLTGDGERLPLRFLRARAEGGWTMELGKEPSVAAAPVPAGRYVVAATGPAGDVVKRAVEVTSGMVADVELTVQGPR